MGEYADDIIDGIYCQHCGDYLGAPTGYPRSCNSCNKPRKHKIKNHQEPKYIRSIIDMCMSKNLSEEEILSLVISFINIKNLNAGSFDENVKLIHSQHKRSFSDYLSSLSYLSKLTSTNILTIMKNIEESCQ